MYEDDDFDDFELDEFDLMAGADFADEDDEDAFEEMEAYMEGALMAESDEEEDAFLGALLSTATSMLPSIISVGQRVLPKFLGAAKQVLNTVRSDPNVRRAAKTGVNVLARTAQDVAKRYASGRPVSGQYISRRAAGYAARALPHALYGRRKMPALVPGSAYPKRTRRPTRQVARRRARSRYYR